MKIWLLNDYNHSKYSFFRDLCSDFSREVGINIEMEIKSKENLWNSMFNFFERPEEKPADIIEIPHQWTSLMTKLGLALPLDLIMKDPEKMDFFPFLKKGMIFEFSQRMYSVPIYFEIICLYYRKDMVLEVFSRSEMDELKWEDFLRLCESLSKKYKRKDYYPLDNTNISGYITSDDILVSVMNRSEGYFSSDNTALNLHKDEVILSFLEYIELARKKYIPLFEENFYDIGFIKKALSSMAFSFRRDFLDMDGMEVTRFPDVMRKNELARSFNFMFFSGADEIDEIKSFMDWFYKQSNILKLSKTLKTFSPFKSDMDKLLTKKEISFFDKIMEKSSLIPNNVVYPSFERMTDEALKEICIKIVNNEYDENEFKDKIMEIKALTEYLISSY